MGWTCRPQSTPWRRRWSRHVCTCDCEKQNCPEPRHAGARVVTPTPSVHLTDSRRDICSAATNHRTTRGDSISRRLRRRRRRYRCAGHERRRQTAPPQPPKPMRRRRRSESREPRGRAASLMPGVARAARPPSIDRFAAIKLRAKPRRAQVGGRRVGDSIRRPSGSTRSFTNNLSDDVPGYSEAAAASMTAL